MAAGQGFKTFATGDVLTAPDVNGYLMQGVLVFASAAARDASITSPQQGQVAFLKDTNATVYYNGSAWVAIGGGMTNPMTTTGDTIYSSSGSTPARLGIGSTGQVLTVASGVPSWATPAGGASGLTLIERNTFSSTTSIISGAVFSSTYDNYLLLLNINSLANSNPSNQLRLRSGSTTTTTGYTFAQANANSTNTASQYGDTNAAGWDLTAGAASIGSFHRIELANPYASQYTHLTCQTDWTTSGTALQIRNIGGVLNNTTSYDKFDFNLQYASTGYYAVYGFGK